MTFKRWFVLVLILSSALLLRFPIAQIPLERDEGEYAYIAQRALAGEIPYKSSFDQKPPGIFLAYALIERWVGTSPAAIHWATQMYTLGTLTIVFLLGEKLFSGFVGALASVLLALMMADPTVLGNASNTETFMILPLTGALYTMVLAQERDSSVWALITGLFLGASCLFKQVALSNGAFILLYLILKTPKGRRHRWLPINVIAGMGAVFGAAAIYFLKEGAGKEFYDCVVGHNLGYVSVTSLANYADNFQRSFLLLLNTFWPVYLLAACGIWSAYHRSTAGDVSFVSYRTSFQMLAGWLLFSFAGIAVGGYFRRHYYIQWLPPVALLAAGQLILWTHIHWLRQRRMLPIVLSALIFEIAVWKGAWYYAPGDVDKKVLTLYGWQDPFAQSLPIARYLSDHSNSEDRIFIFGSEPQILYYASRISASRYIILNPLMARLKGALERQQSVLADLHSNPPKFVVTVFTQASLNRLESSPSLIFDSLHEFLAASYEVCGVVPVQSLKLITGPSAPVLWKSNPFFWGKGPSEFVLAVWQHKE